MCGRFTIAAGAEFIGKYFEIETGMPDITPTWNAAPSSDLPVVHAQLGQRQCQLMHWGLIPSWLKTPDSKYKMINAKAETLGEKPAYRAAFKSRRCLIPANGFYEWHMENGSKQPWYITHETDELMAFAGLWEVWKGENIIQSFTIITRVANETMSKIHQRMPVILPKTHFDQWLDPQNKDTESLSTLMLNASVPLKLQRVSKAVNNPRNDSADLIKAIK